MKNTRERLIEYLEEARAATVAEISRALQVTEADIRYHLGNLQAEGLVAPVSAARPDGPGRPAGRYGLAPRALGDHFDRLADALLSEALEGLPPEQSEQRLKRIAAHLAGSPGARGSLASRLVRAVQRLNELHYAARWEAHAEGPHLILGRCPYAALLPEHPELCRLDALTLEALLGAPAIQTAKLAPDARGAPYCLFLVAKEK